VLRSGGLTEPGNLPLIKEELLAPLFFLRATFVQHIAI
jgi:hypothetical protein